MKLQEFILDLLAKDSVILIKGNHEDLTLELLNGWPKHSYLQYYHHTNGTIDTVLQLTKWYGSCTRRRYRTRKNNLYADTGTAHSDTLITRVKAANSTMIQISRHITATELLPWMPAL